MNSLKLWDTIFCRIAEILFLLYKQKIILSVDVATLSYHLANKSFVLLRIASKGKKLSCYWVSGII